MKDENAVSLAPVYWSRLPVGQRPTLAAQASTASSQSIGSPSDQTAPSAKVYFTVSGLLLCSSKVPNSSSGTRSPSGPKYQNPRSTWFSTTALAGLACSEVLLLYEENSRAVP